jgi:nitrate reductase delta subunit
MERSILAQLAALLDYPDEGLQERLDALQTAVSGRCPEAAEALREFRAAVDGLSSDRLREIYASTFDLNPACCLYAGYHLFGDSYKRGALMAKLNAEYRERGFDPGNELPDHLDVLFRFLSDLDDSGLRSILLEELVLPALSRIVRSFEGTDNVYSALTRAALLALRPQGYEPPRRLMHALPVLEQERISQG